MAAAPATVVRSRRKSARASPRVAHTRVPTSICERRNSGLTCPASNVSHSASISGGGSLTTSRVARSTRKYSSSMPIVNSGPDSNTLDSPHAEDRAGDRARIAARPAAALDLMKKLGAAAVEQLGLFEVDRVPGVGKHHECRGRDRALHQEARFETGVVLVAGHDQGRDLEVAHAVCKIPQ